ncbi:unnamed protein product [Lactuca virosa]|uniref:Uncharacterized protein n=1 Tax=Lactuca virosa TaxID=75947 RepID=A0AAU9NVQ0_9ASTR|nr:unnamed protein product [Lactuca virosa]
MSSSVIQHPPLGLATVNLPCRNRTLNRVLLLYPLLSTSSIDSTSITGEPCRHRSTNTPHPAGNPYQSASLLLSLISDITGIKDVVHSRD